MISGSSSGILLLTMRLPNEIWTPSKPIRAASSSASGLAPSLRFQSVTPIEKLRVAPPAKRTAEAGERRGLKQSATTDLCHKPLPYHLSFRLASHFSVEAIISSQVTTPPR